MKKILCFLLALALAFAYRPVPVASAKTLESARGENIFFYATDAQGKAVLLKIVPLGDLKGIAHGQRDGRNYYISSTDNYPTTQYCEARGLTVPELVEYVKGKTAVAGAAGLTFVGGDEIHLMATDSYGSYNRNWTYDELYGTPRYYFEGMYDPSSGWNTGWEIAGDDDSKIGVTLEEYNAKYKDSDPYYADKRAVFAGGVKTEPILATQSFSGRTTTAALVASTEIGIAEQIAANGGTAAGSLRDMLEDTWSLRLSLPMTEADLMAAHRTAFDNFKWIYNLRLDMAGTPAIRSLGTVEEPVASVRQEGGALSIEIACATPGAQIYYSFDGAPQIPYTGSISVDVSGRGLAADPVTFYMAAVREGWDDAGVITAKYPGLSPAFKTVYSAMTGSALTFSAHDGVSGADWDAWTGAMTFVTMKSPTAGGYSRVDGAKVSIDSAARSVTFDASLFTDTGSYSFVFHAAGYADKSLSVTVKRSAPDVAPPDMAKLGMPLVFTFDDDDYQNGLTVYVAPPGGRSAMIPASWLDRTQPRRVTLRAAYFASGSSALAQPGQYVFSFVNNRYEPGTVDVELGLSSSDIPQLPDVQPEHWYYDAVRYVLGAGVMEPLADGEFGAAAELTRGMLADALYSVSGGEPGEGAAAVTVFDDVAADSRYAEAVAWASGAGIVAGFGDGTFRPDAGITRQEIAAMLHRYRQLTIRDSQFTIHEEPGDLSAFADAGDVAGWARDDMAWAVGARVINGADGKLLPRGNATRAQGAQLVYNMSAWRR
ncbi:MAG: S-layer homology domain-containing protein [Oscillospiraceae bacterium]|jgi:hypothetical protein|nr:S-layer homology domain-containing protein [Oscillospiraceae bacterium]